MYGPLNWNDKASFWYSLEQFGSNLGSSWLCLGDFNALKTKVKSRGSPCRHIQFGCYEEVLFCMLEWLIWALWAINMLGVMVGRGGLSTKRDWIAAWRMESGGVFFLMPSWSTSLGFSQITPLYYLIGWKTITLDPTLLDLKFLDD